MENLKFIRQIVLATVFIVGSGLTIVGGIGISAGHEKLPNTIIMIIGIIFLVIDWLILPGILKKSR